ncbi:OmpA family protein [Noviherbaspirillum galbum]|uniref:OmpA family protein n=1 Tax=Noviherbaspirillum galbum TaxID=2709383 RepID=A0A6B3SML3_9BURK|nr:OmpA family protein [Noviherbaspirillum galbum]NEX61947.1 OmpA family protein [Noviherbaspirillum galbum]
MNRASQWIASIALMLMIASAFAAKDPSDTEGTAEHPQVARFPNFFIDNSKYNDYNEVGFNLKNGEQVKGGKYWFVDYILKEGARQPSTVELVRNYENAFKKAGGGLVYRESPEDVVYRMPLGGSGERWMKLHVDNDGYRYQIEVIDTGSMEQKVEFSADQMSDAIKKNGFVALNGIMFDTGRATIKPESEPLLKEVAALLKKEQSLKLSIEGHTDNVGDKKANLDLSKKRAESVIAYVTKAGIDPRRLKADGKGDTAPVADNRTEEGRAKNRRVELVRF